ncbi:HAD family hydrolase [Metabacillus malikii]|uniref:Hydrolase of the HAD superfamily n=1 Tax=Metabacillus malikii TaxID=1504265 RepID=A0ABT9ZK74_9BACI|nr:HAD family hydrolase [Metabacillus malikii]MDQ0232667.1 putative hydrolase of the HAD superfamily [Metabacillus malikii]
MINAILFDFDGTLLNRDESVKKFITNQYDRLHQWVGHVPKETYVARFIELDKRGYVWKDKVYQQLTRECQITGLTWEALLKDYLHEFKHHCVPYDGLIQMLERLKSRNILLGIISNGFGQFQLDNIKALGIAEYFNVILISEWEGIKKPNPKIFNRALKKLNVSSSQTIFVGDHPENDVYAAQHVGITGIWKKDLQWDNVQADYTIQQLGELPQIITNLNEQ